MRVGNEWGGTNREIQYGIYKTKTNDSEAGYRSKLSEREAFKLFSFNRAKQNHMAHTAQPLAQLGSPIEMISVPFNILFSVQITVMHSKKATSNAAAPII